MQDRYNVGDIIKLDNNHEYCIIKKYNEYYVLLSQNEPLEILIVNINGNEINVVIDKKIIEEVLSK